METKRYIETDLDRSLYYSNTVVSVTNKIEQEELDNYVWENMMIRACTEIAKDPEISHESMLTFEKTKSENLFGEKTSTYELLVYISRKVPTSILKEVTHD